VKESNRDGVECQRIAVLGSFAASISSEEDSNTRNGRETSDRVIQRTKGAYVVVLAGGIEDLRAGRKLNSQFSIYRRLLVMFLAREERIVWRGVRESCYLQNRESGKPGTMNSPNTANSTELREACRRAFGVRSA